MRVFLIKYANKVVRVFGIFEITNKTLFRKGFNFLRLYKFFNTSPNRTQSHNSK